MIFISSVVLLYTQSLSTLSRILFDDTSSSIGISSYAHRSMIEGNL